MMWLYGRLNETVPAGLSPSYYYQSRQPLIIGVDSMYIIIVVTAVMFRFYSRRLSGTPFGLDDWLCLFSVPFSITPSIIDLIQLSNGMGRHIPVVLNTNPILVTQYARNLYIVLLFYNPGLVIFKLAFLATYCRIFSTARWLRYTAIVLAVLIVMWGISIQFFHIFRCHPISEQWIPNTGTCVISRIPYYYLQSIPSIIFDITILVLPIHSVWKIQLPKLTRLGVLFIFMLGGLVTIISITRLSVLTQLATVANPDLLYDYIDLCMWSDAESTAGILSACLITYGPLLRLARRKIGVLTEKTLGSYASSSKRTYGSSGNFSDISDKSYAKDTNGNSTYIDAGSDACSDQIELTGAEKDLGLSRSSLGIDDIERQRITEEGSRQVHVRREVRISRE